MNLTRLVPVPGGINSGLTSARQSTMLALLGNPRGSYNQDCQPVTHPQLMPLIVLRHVGPFKVRGLRPAVDSLGEVMADIRIEAPEVFAALGSAGMLCVRNQRGSATAISNHSWGTAIDLTLGGALDARGDGRVQAGLAEIHPLFNRHGWFWGAAFGIEDAMHFECSEQLIRQWAAAGMFKAGNAGAGEGTPPASPPSLLTLGDRGPEVAELQALLGQATLSRLLADGVFGHGTFAAVTAFQGRAGLVPDGAVGTRTWAALRAQAKRAA